MSGQSTSNSLTGLVVYIGTESLYKKPIKKRLIELGCCLRASEPMPKEEFLVTAETTDVEIIQADLWSGIRKRMSNSTHKILIGPPSYFYYWKDINGLSSAAYVTPFDSLNVIVESMEWVTRGHHYFSRVIKQFINLESKSRQEELLNVKLGSHLTKSELEILVSIGEGYTTRQIAQSRFRSRHTVKTQRKKVREKLGCNRGVRLANFAGREVNALRTLHFIEENEKVLKKICQNTT